MWGFSVVADSAQFSTIVTELVGQSRNRKPIRILSMGASSRWRTYSIQSFTVLRPTAVRIAEVVTMLERSRPAFFFSGW